jgi:hypothetical protein
VTSESACRLACEIENEFLCRSFLYRGSPIGTAYNCQLFHLDHKTLPDGPSTYLNAERPLIDNGERVGTYYENLCESKYGEHYVQFSCSQQLSKHWHFAHHCSILYTSIAVWKFTISLIRWKNNATVVFLATALSNNGPTATGPCAASDGSSNNFYNIPVSSFKKFVEQMKSKRIVINQVQFYHQKVLNFNYLCHERERTKLWKI